MYILNFNVYYINSFKNGQVIVKKKKINMPNMNGCVVKLNQNISSMQRQN